MITATIAYNTKSLSILGLTRGKLLPGPLPSWAVDWRKSQSTQGQRIDDHLCLFNASTGRIYRPNAPPMAHDNRLIVRGRIVDKVGYVSRLSRPIMQKEATDNIQLLEELEQLSVSNKESVFPETTAHAQLSTRVLAVLVAYDPGPRANAAETDAVLARFLHAYDQAMGVSKIMQSGQVMNEASFDPKDLTQRAGTCWKKRLFVGIGQRLLGLGPTDVTADDLVCILHGSTVPVLLRSRPYGYEVIGQCYYEEWMYGDRVNWDEDKAQEFVLI
jgi:hypothetical protein